MKTALFLEKYAKREPTKLTKPGFGGFGSTVLEEITDKREAAIPTVVEGIDYLRVHSRHLGEWIYFARGRDSVPDPNNLTVYAVEELRALMEANPSPAELRKLHRAKTMFEGEISR